MSEVIMDFIEPYMESADTYEAQDRLISIAVLAWNASLLPEDRAQKVIDEAMVGQSLSDSTREMALGIIKVLFILCCQHKGGIRGTLF